MSKRWSLRIYTSSIWLHKTITKKWCTAYNNNNKTRGQIRATNSLREGVTGDGCWLDASVWSGERRSVHARSQAEGDRAPSTIFPPAVILTPARLSGVIWLQAMRAPRLPRWLLCESNVKEGGGVGGTGGREWMLREVKKKTQKNLWACLVSTGQIPALPSSKLTRWSQDDNDSDSLSVRRSAGGGRSRRRCRNSDEPRPRASWRFQEPV